MELSNKTGIFLKHNIVNLSVVIPTKNREKDLIGCLDSIFKQDYLPKEIIIIDQSFESSEENIKRIIPYTVKFIYIYNKNIRGLTEAKNEGASKAGEDLILFLDDDIVLLEDALKNILDVFNQDKQNEIGGIGGFILNEKPPFYSNFVKFFFYGPFSFYNDQSDFQQKALKGNKIIKLSKLVPGGASCVRKEIFNDYKFDENLSGYSYGEDSIFGYVVSKKYKLYLCSEFKVFHKRISSLRDDKQKNIQIQIVWWFYFFNRYVEKTMYNFLCYFWSMVGIMLKVLIGCYDLRLIRGASYGFRGIIQIILQKTTIESAINNCLSSLE